jgi:hypothetical protein
MSKKLPIVLPSMVEAENFSDHPLYLVLKHCIHGPMMVVNGKNIPALSESKIVVFDSLVNDVILKVL